MVYGFRGMQLGGVGLDVWENEAEMFFSDWCGLGFRPKVQASGGAAVCLYMAV